MKSTIVNIEDDGKYIFENIQGDIKKIYFEADEPLTNVDVELITEESEIIYKTKLGNNIVILYPYNNMLEQDRGDYYYSNGNIGLIINGLLEHQKINKVSVFYK